MAEDRDTKEETKTPAKETKRPTQYTHTTCETDGEMSPEVESRYYSRGAVTSLFCTHCGAGIRIGPDGEMNWRGTKDRVPLLYDPDVPETPVEGAAAA